jgi:hypothetical protein
MPLYKKIINDSLKNLDELSINDCNDMLLCLRYLKFRNDPTLPKHEYEKRIRILEEHIKKNNHKNNLYYYN